MPPCSGHLQRPLDVLLPLDLREVRRVGWRRQRERIHAGLIQRDRAQPLQVGRQVAQVLHRDHLQPIDQRRLGRVGGRDEDAADGLLAGQRGDGQDAGDVPH